jgi:hypothetical protein
MSAASHLKQSALHFEAAGEHESAALLNKAEEKAYEGVWRILDAASEL